MILSASKEKEDRAKRKEATKGANNLSMKTK